MSNQTPPSSSRKQNTPATPTPSASNLQGKTKVFILTPDLLKKLGIANKIPNLSTFKVAGNDSTPEKNIGNNLLTNTQKRVVSVLNTNLAEIKNKCDNIEIKQPNAEQNTVKSKLLSMLTSKLQNEPTTSTEIVKYKHPTLFEKQITSNEDSSSDPQEIKLLQEKKSEANKLSIQEINLDNNAIITDSSTINKEHISKVTNLPDSITSGKNIRLKLESLSTHLKSTCSEIQNPTTSIKIDDSNKTVREVNNPISQKVTTCKKNSDLKTEPPNTGLNRKLNTGQTPVKYIKIVKQINVNQPTKSTDILLPVISSKKETILLPVISSKKEITDDETKSNMNVLSPTLKINNSGNPSESSTLESIQLTNCTKNNNSNTETQSKSSSNIHMEENVTINNNENCFTKSLEENENQIKEQKNMAPNKILLNATPSAPIENIPENIIIDIKATPRERKRKMTTEDESPIRKSSRQRRLSTIHSDYVTELKLHDGSSQKISKKERKSTESKQSKDLTKFNTSNEQKSLNKVHNETKLDPNIEETMDLTGCISDNIATQENKQNNNSINNKNSHKLIVQSENENAIYNKSNNNLQYLTPNSINEELNKQSDENIQPCYKKRIIIHENILITPPKTLERTISTNLKNILYKNLETNPSMVVNNESIDTKKLMLVDSTEVKSDTKKFKMVSNPGNQSIDTKQFIVVSNPDLKSSKAINIGIESNKNIDNLQLTISNTDLNLSKTIDTDLKLNKTINIESKSSKSIDTTQLMVSNTDLKSSKTVDTNLKSSKNIDAVDNTDSKLKKTIDIDPKPNKSIDSTQLTVINTDLKSSKTVDTNLRSSKSIDVDNNTNSKLSKTIDIDSKPNKSIDSKQLTVINIDLKSSKTVDTDLKSRKSIAAVNNTDSKLSKTICIESKPNKSIDSTQLTVNNTDLKSNKTVDTDLKPSKRIDTKQLTDNLTELKSSKGNDTKHALVVNNTENTNIKTNIRRYKRKVKLLKKMEWEGESFKVKSPIRTYPVKLKGRLSTESINTEVNTKEKSTDDNELNENNSLKSDMELASSSCETPITGEIIKTENNLTRRSSQKDNKSEISIKSNKLTKELNITAENKQSENVNIKFCDYIDNKTQEHVIKIEERSLLNKKTLSASVLEIKSPENIKNIESKVQDTHKHIFSIEDRNSTLEKDRKNQMEFTNIEKYKMQLQEKINSQISNIVTKTNSEKYILNKTVISKPISKIIHSSANKILIYADKTIDTLHNNIEIGSKKDTGGHEKILADTVHRVKETEDHTVQESKTENSPATITEGENINYGRVTNTENKNNLFTPKRKVGRLPKQKPKELDIQISSTDNETHIKEKQEISHSSLNTTTNAIRSADQEIISESVSLPVILKRKKGITERKENNTECKSKSVQERKSFDSHTDSIRSTPDVRRKGHIVNDLITKKVPDINVKREQESLYSTVNFTENNTSNEETFTDSVPLTSNVQRVNIHMRQEQAALQLPDNTEELITNESNSSGNQDEEKHTDSDSRRYWFTIRRPRGRPRKHKIIEENTTNTATNQEILRTTINLTSQRDNVKVVNTENSPSTTQHFENKEEQNTNLKSENILLTLPKKRGRKPKQKIIIEPEAQFLPPIEIPTPRVPRRPPKSETDNSIIRKSNRGKKRKRDDSNKPKSVDEVTCAICQEVVKKLNWPFHTIRHNFLCWHVDEPAIDLNDKKLVQYVLTKSHKSLRKHFKHFTCDTCGDRKKSVLGFMSHLDVCQLTDEEREALMVACDICEKKVLPQSLKYHMNIHKQSQITETVIEKNNDKNDGSNTMRSKRKAATKAVNLIQEVTNNEIGRSKSNREDIVIGKKRYKKGSDPGSVFFNYGAILKLEMKFRQGFKKCSFPNCTFKSDDFSELKTHINSCSFLKSDDYVCKLCLHVEKNESAMQEHYSSTHFGPEVFVSASESDDDGNEDVIKPDTEVVKKRTSSFPKQSSEYTKPTYKVAFLRKERRRTSNKVTSFLPALKWTAEFRNKYYYKETFKDILCLSSKWIPVSLKDQEEYMPLITKSMSVNMCSVTYTFPNVQQRDHEWKEYDLFESNITNDTVNIFCGGPVWAFAWVPTPEYEICDQYLAVSVHKDFEATYKISESYSGKEVIQFWNFGPLQSNRKNINTPTLEFTIGHDHGMVWCMEWCPSGYYDLEKPNGDEELQKLGLLALACSDGNISIYSVGKPQREDNNHNMFLVKPVYKLILQESSEQPLGQWKYQATRISWSKHSNHNVIAGGYTNGVVCLWDLTTTSPLLKSEEDGTIILKPYHSFQAHSSAVSALILYPLVDKGQRWLLTGSWDRTFKYWDLNNTSAPFSSFGKRGIITDGVWISHWLCSFFAFDDVYSFGHTVTTVQNPRDFAFKQCSALASNSVVMSMSSSDWASSIAQASLAGELTGSFPRTILMSYDIDKTLKCKRMLMSYNEIIDKTKKVLERKDIMKVERKSEKLFIDKDDKSFTKYLNNHDLEPYVEEPTTYVEASKKYGLVFCDLEMERISTFPEESFEIVKQSNRLREAPTELYPITSLNRVAWNPNKQAYLYIACGYQNGFVRLRCMRFMNAEGYSKSNS